MSIAQTRPRRPHSPPAMYAGLTFLGLPPSEKKSPRPLPSPKSRLTKSAGSIPRSVKSAPSMDNMTTTTTASHSPSVFKTLRRSLVLSKSMEFTFKKGNKGKEKASDTSSNNLGCTSLKSPTATLSSRCTSVAELPTLDFGPDSPVICISKSPSSPTSSNGADIPDTTWNNPSASSAAITPPSPPSTSLPSVTIAIPEEAIDKSRRDSSCTTTTTISSMVFCYPDPDTVRRRPTFDETINTDGISQQPKLTVDNSDKSAMVTKPLLTLLSPPRLQKHARSSSTPSVSPGWSQHSFSQEDDKENVNESSRRSVRDDDDEYADSSPPSPLVFARRSTDTDSDHPATVAFPDLPPTMDGQPKKLGRSKTIPHLSSQTSNPNLGKRRHVDLGAIEPEPSRQAGPGWTGRWNRRDMQDVIQSLRTLK